MTLIVYKPGMLAADSRMSSKHTEGKECISCPKCNEKTSMLINDDRNKITIIPKNKKYIFEDDRILAYSAAGNVRVSTIMKKIIDAGEDLKEVVEAFIKFNIDSDYPFAVVFMVGEKFTYRVSVSGKGFRIVKNELYDPIAIGSGKEGADWVEHITGGILSPIDLIVLVKTLDNSVGGAVTYVDLTSAELKIETVKEETGRTFDLEKIQKAIHDLVPKPVSPKPINRKRPLKRKVNV